MVTPTNHAIARPDLRRVGPLAVWAFLQHLSAKYRGRPKKVLQFERKAPSWYCANTMVNPALVNALRS